MVWKGNRVALVVNSKIMRTGSRASSGRHRSINHTSLQTPLLPLSTIIAAYISEAIVTNLFLTNSQP
jgi:hypothetical protein